MIGESDVQPKRGSDRVVNSSVMVKGDSSEAGKARRDNGDVQMGGEGGDKMTMMMEEE